MKSVLQNDKQKIDHGKLLAEMLNQGIKSFTPDMMFSQIVKNYQMAEQVYGESMLRLLSGYDPSYLKRNINIPEFQRELAAAIEHNVKALRDEGLMDGHGGITERGENLAAFLMYVEELDHLTPKGAFGERLHKKTAHYGDRGEVRVFRKGDRYKDVDVPASIHTALRRGHTTVHVNDLKTSDRQSKGKICVIYGLDASGSMKGTKLELAKKAGIALAHKAISNRDSVGLIVFGSEVKEALAPTRDIKTLLREIALVQASRQTDFAAMIEKATELFPGENATKHLVLLTDALPTMGKKPEEEALQHIATAAAAGITTSLIGINLDSKGRELAQQMVDIGRGRLFAVKGSQAIDRLIIEDYEALR
ncbi:VWA domain-containing protein [Candidatus Woesearchaeota archaeon]|nr:VWA domain-containing protein [Candidatus Woesearchaeota archaeon]